MDDSEETLRRTIGRLTNDVLLKRWASGGFSDKALAIAEAEMSKRGLDTSAPAVAQVHRRDARLEAQLQSRKRAQMWRRVAIVVGIVVAGAIAAKFFAGAGA